MRNLRNKFSNFINLRILYKVKYSQNGTFQSIVPPIVTQTNNTIIENNVLFQDWNTLEQFGNFNFIGKNTYIEYCKSIGSFCSISFDVKIGLKNHNLKTISSSPYFYKTSKDWVKTNNLPKSTPVTIGHDVLISANAIILENVTIGTGAVIAAGAVVNKDVPPYAIVGGVPAKIIKYRFSPTIIDRLIASEWWKTPPSDLKKLNLLFSSPEEFLTQIRK